MVKMAKSLFSLIFTLSEYYNLLFSLGILLDCRYHVSALLLKKISIYLSSIYLSIYLRQEHLLKSTFECNLVICQFKRFLLLLFFQETSLTYNFVATFQLFERNAFRCIFFDEGKSWSSVDKLLSRFFQKLLYWFF